MNVKIAQNVFSLVLVVVLAGLINEGLALKCYECNSYADRRCNNPDNTTMPDLVRECPENSTMCRKIEQTFYIGDDEQTRIHRQCATQGELGDCLEKTGTYKFKVWYCHCKNGDFCNSAPSMTSSSMGLAVALIASLSYLHRLL